MQRGRTAHLKQSSSFSSVNFQRLCIIFNLVIQKEKAFSGPRKMLYSKCHPLPISTGPRMSMHHEPFTVEVLQSPQGHMVWGPSSSKKFSQKDAHIVKSVSPWSHCLLDINGIPCHKWESWSVRKDLRLFWHLCSAEQARPSKTGVHRGVASTGWWKSCEYNPELLTPGPRLLLLDHAACLSG